METEFNLTLVIIIPSIMVNGHKFPAFLALLRRLNLQNKKNTFRSSATLFIGKRKHLRQNVGGSGEVFSADKNSAGSSAILPSL